MIINNFFYTAMLFTVLEIVALYEVAIIVFGILSIILFFKIWGMCNDVRKIRNHLLISSEADEKPSGVSNEEVAKGDGIEKFKVNQLVVVKQDESQFRVSSISHEGGKVRYYSSKHQKYFTENEIEEFEKYWEEKKKS